MNEEAKRELRDAADYLAGFRPIPSTFVGMKPIDAAKASIRMCVEALRERAGDKPNSERAATADELAQVK